VQAKVSNPVKECIVILRRYDEGWDSGRAARCRARPRLRRPRAGAATACCCRRCAVQTDGTPVAPP